MLHLLPEDHKQKVITEYRQRVFVIFCLGILLLVLVSTIFMIPAYLSSYGKYEVVQTIKSNLQKNISRGENNQDADKVKEIVLSVETLKSYTLKEFPTDVYERILKSKPKGVTINRFVYTPNVSVGVTSEPTTVDMSGVANTRAELLRFSDALKRDKAFKSVNIPLSSFAKDRAIEYSVKLIISNQPLDWGYIPADATTSVSVLPGVIDAASTTATSSITSEKLQ